VTTPAEDPAGADAGAASEAREVAIEVPRTARYYVAGGGEAPPDECWVVLHGYGQLAGRFVRHFAPLAGPARVVVAPEALSRFYLEGTGRTHAAARVGATWMTREDRLHEIADQRRYLDRVCDDALARWPGVAPRLVVVGFSQGAATAVRWAAAATRPIARIVAWAGTLPQELDAPAAAALDGRLTMLAGLHDEVTPPERVREELARLETLGLVAPVRWYEGGHRIDAAVLREIADARRA
jgi:predicted esterase